MVNGLEPPSGIRFTRWVVQMVAGNFAAAEGVLKDGPAPGVQTASRDEPAPPDETGL